MDFQDGLVLERTGDGIAFLTLNRPEKKNAVTFTMWQAIAVHLAELGYDEATRVLVLRGSGADFCAGADIGEFDSLRGDPETARQYERANSAAFAALRQAPFPVVAAISGICFGGGCGLAAASDLRIATPDACFSVPAARLGLAYPADAMADLVHSLGLAQARHLAYTGARLDAGAALRCGFLLEVVAAAQLEQRALALAEAIADSAPLSVRASKAAIRAALTGGEADLAHAREIGDLTFTSEDYAEGRAAFRERRAPVFQGR